MMLPQGSARASSVSMIREAIERYKDHFARATGAWTGSRSSAADYRAIRQVPLVLGSNSLPRTPVS